jgi:hypothetical protein
MKNGRREWKKCKNERENRMRDKWKRGKCRIEKEAGRKLQNDLCRTFVESKPNEEKGND